MFDKNNFEKCFYTPEELEEAINSMSSNEAYRLATSYYNIVNSISQFNKEKIDNIAQNSQNMAEYVRRYSSEL